MSSSARIVISGYYGFGNAGDEAVLAGLTDIFRAALPGVSLAVASGNPEATRQLHGVDAFHRYRWQEFLRQVRGCDVFVSGGGSLLQDVTSRRSIYYYLGALAAALICRKPVFLCGQGIGPIGAPSARALTAALLNHARIISVRDPDSADTLKALGVQRPQVRVTADPVFALRPAPPAAGIRLLRAAGSAPEAPRVAFALRSWPHRRGTADHKPPATGATEDQGRGSVVEAAAAAAAFAQRELGAQVVFVPMQPPVDNEIARQIEAFARIPALVLEGGYPPREYLALFGQMDLVVAMRLHALIFAAVLGVPLVGILYDPKIKGFLRQLGRTPAAEMASNIGDVLTRVIAHTWSRREAEALLLKERASLLRERAMENGELLASLL